MTRLLRWTERLAYGVRHALDGEWLQNTKHLNSSPYCQRHLRRASQAFPLCKSLTGIVSGAAGHNRGLWPAAPLTIPVKLKSALQTPVQQRRTVNNVHDSPGGAGVSGGRVSFTMFCVLTLPSLPSREHAERVLGQCILQGANAHVPESRVGGSLLHRATYGNEECVHVLGQH